MDLRPGVRLDRYTLVLRLGEGGQATVWKAIDPLDGGAVRALKVFELGGPDDSRTERLRREAKACAGARHPGLLPCRGLFEDPTQNVALLVFDFVRGRSLADALHDSRMTPEHRRGAVKQLADTLAYVHGSGIVHRDVKPDNVLVTDAFWDAPTVAGTLKLVDFGIAAPVGNPHPLTQEGGVVGTAPYLAPELVEKSGVFPPGEDLQRDVFAFGVLAWEVLVGGHPTGLPLQASRDAFAGVYLAGRAQKRIWPPDAPPSPELAVVRACLSLSPAERPGSCVLVADALSTAGGETRSTRTSEPFSIDKGQRSSQTEGHVSPTTAPMAGQPPMAGAPTWTPPPVPISRRNNRSGSGGPQGPARDKKSILIYVAAGGAVLLVALAAYWVGSRSSETSSGPVMTFPAAPPNVTAAPPDPAPRAAPTSASLRTDPICCSSTKRPCDSGRPCQPQDPCRSVIAEAETFRLRVIGGYLGPSPADQIQFPGKSTKICVKNLRTGDKKCALTSTLYKDGSDRVNRVVATMSDMTDPNSRNMAISIHNGSTVLYDGPAIANPGGYKTTALCSNITFHLGTWETYVGKISVFLDDP